MPSFGVISLLALPIYMRVNTVYAVYVWYMSLY